ncbi:hypothetical protein QVD17_11053 [Tagetes erecta]|uniref:Uncharacterized protein n=1 Tax=Tagetes erecta TaxID=13708 RepID=A0AAD8L2C8_TARER|nr:hypothetical protein QVD17_11053 [Tagetes erecta]
MIFLINIFLRASVTARPFFKNYVVIYEVYKSRCKFNLHSPSRKLGVTVGLMSCFLTSKGMDCKVTNDRQSDGLIGNSAKRLHRFSIGFGGSALLSPSIVIHPKNLVASSNPNTGWPTGKGVKLGL